MHMHGPRPADGGGGGAAELRGQAPGSCRPVLPPRPIPLQRDVYDPREAPFSKDAPLAVDAPLVHALDVTRRRRALHRGDARRRRHAASLAGVPLGDCGLPPPAGIRIAARLGEGRADVLGAVGVLECVERLLELVRGGRHARHHHRAAAAAWVLKGPRIVDIDLACYGRTTGFYWVLGGWRLVPSA